MSRQAFEKIFSSLAVGLLALALTGCTVRSKYTKPEMPVPETWRVPVETGSSLANLTWWEVFQDPELQELIRAALERNTNLQIAAANVIEASAQVGIARSQQLPQIQASGSIQRKRISSEGSFSYARGTGSQFNDFLFSGNVFYLVDFWGQYRQATEESRRLLLATEEAQRNVMITVVSGVAQAYFQLRTLDEQLEITRRTVSSFEDSLQLTRDLYRFGVSTELDVRQAETALFSVRANVPALQQQIQQRENTLSFLLGRNPSAIPRGRKLMEQPLPSSVPAGLPSELLVRRPDIMQAGNQLAASYAAVDVARAQLFPQFQLTASGGTESAQLTQLATIPSLTFNLLAGLTAPIFEGGRLRSNLRLTKAQRQAALVNYQGVVLQAFREVDDALIAYQKNREQAAEEEKLVGAASAALDLANDRYSGGVATYLEVLDSERQLYSAQFSLAQTRGSILISLVQLYQALGGGWQ